MDHTRLSAVLCTAGIPGYIRPQGIGPNLCCRFQSPVVAGVCELDTWCRSGIDPSRPRRRELCPPLVGDGAERAELPGALLVGAVVKAELVLYLPLRRHVARVDVDHDEADIIDPLTPRPGIARSIVSGQCCLGRVIDQPRIAVQHGVPGVRDGPVVEDGAGVVAHAVVGPVGHVAGDDLEPLAVKDRPERGVRDDTRPAASSGWDVPVWVVQAIRRIGVALVEEPAGEEVVAARDEPHQLAAVDPPDCAVHALGRRQVAEAVVDVRHGGRWVLVGGATAHRSVCQ